MSYLSDLLQKIKKEVKKVEQVSIPQKAAQIASSPLLNTLAQGFQKGVQETKQTPLKQFFFPTAQGVAPEAFRQYVGETGKSALQTLLGGVKLSPPYEAYRAITGNPIMPQEKAADLIGAASNLLSTWWRIQPEAPIIGAGLQSWGDIRRYSQGQISAEQLSQSPIKGVNEQPGFGQLFTDDQKKQNVIDLAFMATMIIAPFAQKKLGGLSSKYGKLNRVADTLGVDANTPMSEVASKWKSEVIKYQDVFAGKGTSQGKSRVAELNDAYNTLKQAGMVDKNFAAFFDRLSLGLTSKPISKAEHARLYEEPKRLGAGEAETPFTEAEVAQDKLSSLINYSDELLKRGYTKAEINKIGFNEGRALIQANISPKDYFATKAEATRLGKFKAPADSIPVDQFEREMNSLNVKDKVNWVDYMRTPRNVLKKLNLNYEAEYLKRSWNAYQDQLPVEIAKIAKWGEQLPGESNKRVFQYLDGNPIVLSDVEQKVAEEIKTYLAQWADKLDLPEESRISNYITHIFDQDIKGKEFPQEIAQLIRYSGVPGSVYDPFLMKRWGIEGYKEDVVQALQAYVKRATRKYNLDPALHTIRAASKDFEESQYNYVKRYISGVNMRPTEIEKLVDNWIKSIPKVGYRFGVRPTTQITSKARRAVYRGLIGLNPVSALKNLTQATNTFAELGTKYTFIGYVKVVQNLPKIMTGKQTELEATHVLADSFIQDQSLVANKKLMDKLDPGLFYMFNTAEKINRGAAYWGAKAKYLKQGMTEVEAVEKAKDTVEKTQFKFGAIEVPVAMQSDIMKTLFQFQTFSLKQVEFLGGKVKERDIAGLIRYIASTMFFVATLGKLFGWDISDLLPGFRFGTPPTLQLPKGLYDVATGAPDKYGNEPEPNILKRLIENPDVQKGAIAYIPGGGQIKKSYEGLKAYRQGYSATKSGNARYPIPQTPLNLFRMLMGGQYSTPEAQRYFNEKQSPLGKRQTQNLIEGGMPYFNEIIENRKQKAMALKELYSSKDYKEASPRVKERMENRVIARYD